MASFDEMRQYIRDALYPYINSRAGFEFTAQQSVDEAVRDGVAILEMSLDVRFLRFYREPSAYLAFVESLAARYAPTIDFRPEIGVSKGRPPHGEIPLAMQCVDSGLFQSIDLYGNEQANPPEEYIGLYQHAGRRGLRLKAHVGEFGDAALVERTLKALGLHEVQHGVAAASSKPLMATLRSSGIRLNVCPGSNVALSVTSDLERHPIATLVRSGVRVSIGSDDKTVFGRSVSEEYLALYRSGVLSAVELDSVRLGSLDD
jgi:adenosine deaminase